MHAVGRAENTGDGFLSAVATEGQTFDEFFEAHRDRLFRMLCVITGSRHEAEDLAQEAFVNVWERWDSVRRMEDPVGYLHRTATNAFRSRYRRAVMVMRKAVRLAPPPDVFQAVADRQIVRQTLASLSPRQRAVLVLTEALGYTAEESGKMLGIRASTIRALHYQARRTLRSMARDRGATDD